MVMDPAAREAWLQLQRWATRGALAVHACCRLVLAGSLEEGKPCHHRGTRAPAMGAQVSSPWILNFQSLNPECMNSSDA